MPALCNATGAGQPEDAAPEHRWRRAQQVSVLLDRNLSHLIRYVYVRVQ